jgi:hypothetical protein
MTTKSAARRRPAGKARTTTKTTTRRAGSSRKATFDVIPGTHIDEYVAPWLLGVLVIPVAGLGIHVAIGSTAWVWLFAFTTLVAGAALAAVTWHEAQTHATFFVRVRAAMSVDLAFTAIALTAIIGPARVWLWIMGWTGAVMAISWNVARTEAVRGNGTEPEKEQKSGLDELVGLPGVRVSQVKGEGARTTANLHVQGAQDAEDVQAAARRLKAVTKATSIRVVPDRGGNPQKAHVTLLHEDVLKDRIPWPGPSAPGKSIADPLRVGMREDGLPRLFWLTGSGVRAPFLGGIVGVPGSGKSVFFRTVCGEIATRTDAVLWLIDTAKGSQTARPVLGMIDWLAANSGEAGAMLAAVERVSRRRADWLGEHGFDQWEAGCGLPALIVWVEEAARVADRFAERIIRLSELVRSTGVIIMFSMQRMSASNMPSDARHNLTGAVCFGTGDSVSASFVLSDGTIDSGARPDLWKAAKPGYHYMEAPGVPEDEWAIEGRNYDITKAELSALVTDWAHVRASLDPMSVAAAGDAYRDAVRRRAQDGPAVPTPRSGDEREDEMEDDDEDGPVDEYELEKEAAMLAEDEQEARADLPEPPKGVTVEQWQSIDPDVPVPAPAGFTDFDLADGMAEGERLTPVEQAEAVRRILSGLLDGATAPTQVATADIVDAWMATPGMPARPAIYRWLARYQDLGLVEDLDRGKWLVHPAATTKTVTVGDDDDFE